MKQIKVFIIEDERPVINKLQKELDLIGSDIIPSFYSSEVEFKGDYYNQRDLQIIYRSPEYLIKFKEIITKVFDIDLFIVDISLESNQRDQKGIPIIHHLVDNIDIYNKGRSKIIVLSRYGDSSNMKQKFDQSKVTYISKDVNSDYSIDVRNYIKDNFELSNENETTKNDTKSDVPQSKERTNEKKDKSFKKNLNKIKKISGGEIRVWFNKNFFYPANYYLDKFIIIVFGVLILGALVFALKGITSDFYNYFNIKSDSIGTADLADTSENKIKILEVVEHIFIYLLPFFILLGFYNFYSSTTAVRWRGDSRTDIDFDNSIKGINTSKVILLSALLSFTLIIAIEQVFIKGETETKTLIAYGVFIIILMAFILLISRENKGKDNPDKKDK